MTSSDPWMAPSTHEILESVYPDRSHYVGMIETAGSSNTETPFQMTIIGKVWFQEDALTLFGVGYKYMTVLMTPLSLPNA